MGIEGFFGILPRSVGEASNLPAFGSGGGQFARFQHRGCAIPCPHSILRAGRNPSNYYQGLPQNSNAGGVGSVGPQARSEQPPDLDFEGGPGVVPWSVTSVCYF